LRAAWLGQDGSTPKTAMPYVNVRITRDGVTAQQKAQIVAEITGTLQRVLGKRPDQTHIVIDEIELENWGFSGMLTSEYRKQQAGQQT
jgi:4-oxalocrotonate tautomerase